MRIKYNVSIDDMVAFNIFHHKHSPAAKRTMLFSGIVFSLGLFLLFCALGLYTRRWDSLVFGSVLCSLYAIWFFCGQRRLIGRQIRKMLSEGSDKINIGEHELEIREDELVLKRECAESRFRWEAVERLALTADYSFIYVGATSAVIMPRESIVEGNYEEFLKILKQKLGDRPGTGGVGEKHDWSKSVVVDEERFYQADTRAGKHSGLGIASFLLSIVAGGILFFVFIFLILFAAITPGSMENNRTMAMIIGFLLISAFFISLIGIGLGVAGAGEKDRKKIYAVLGLIFNSVIFLGFAVPLIILKLLA